MAAVQCRVNAPAMYRMDFAKTAFWFPDRAIRKHLHTNEIECVRARPIPGRALPRDLRVNAGAGARMALLNRG
ncbi:hypothetical protein LB577_27490, partial [Mesorhizobium sp. B283B1A]|uniref:hypothetical protein n=1 Tax=Mesorhizobium sp. B283B1A TaxID=2876665 RepID=UPI001CD0C7CD